MSFLTNKTLDKFNIYILESFITSPELKIFKEILEIDNIIKKPQIIKNLEDIQEDKEKCNLLFFDKNSISLIKTLNNEYKHLDVKTFFVSKEINNDLYNLFYNGYIIDPKIEDKDLILSYIIDKILSFEKIKFFEGNNRKILSQKNQLDKIFEIVSNNSLISKLDVNGKITFVNDIFAKTFNKKKEDFEGQTYEVLDYFKSCDLKIKELKENDNICDGWSGIVEYELNNIKYVFDTKIISETNYLTGNISGFLVIQNDISDLVNKNKETKQMLEKAKLEASMKSNFLATMSHEIRTPLNGMLPYIDLLLDTDGLKQEQLDYIYTIKNSSESLLRIINDILDFSKIESGKLEIENISFDAIHEFETIVDLYIAKANEKNIKLLTFIEPTLPHLIGDPLRIKQIIHNFLSNAIKFTPEKGEINFIVESENIDNKMQLNISIKDNGKGIAKEHQELIFTPFSQSDNSITRNFGGTGLGLSISKNLASLMNGKITLDSELGKGSTFSISIILDIDNNMNTNSKFEKNIFKKIAIFKTDKNKFQSEAQLLCKYLEAMEFSYAMVYKEDDLKNYDVLFILSTGNDTIDVIDLNFLKEHRVVTILNANVQNRNKYNSSLIIEMPINGSKIYDAINDIENIKNNCQKNENRVIKNNPNNKTTKYNANVLVAEDNLTNQKLVKTLLLKHDLNVFIADNGEIALNEYKEKGFGYYDLILLDIHMPVMDGIETITSILEIEKNQKEKSNIVALTADAIKTHQQAYLEIGFSGFLAKPIEKNKFESTLHFYLKDKIKSDEDSNFNNDFLIEEAELNLLSECNKQSIACKKREKTEINLSKNIEDIQLYNDRVNEKNKVKKIDNIIEELDLDVETAQMLLDDFMEQWSGFKIKLNEALINLNHEEIQSIAHSIKGAAGSLQLNEIYLICKDLEQIAKEQSDKNIIETYKIYIEKLILEIENN